MRITLLNKTAGGISGGYRKYLCAMLPRLESDPRVSSVQCVAPSSWRTTEWLPFGADTALIEYAASRLARIPAHVRTEIVRFAPDVVFVPSERTFHYPLAPVVNMFRNLEPFTDGIRHSVLKNIVTIARRCDARRMFTRTAKLIVPSEFVRNYLVTQESVPSELLSVVHYGSDDLASERSGVKRPFRGCSEASSAGFPVHRGSCLPGTRAGGCIACTRHNPRSLRPQRPIGRSWGRWSSCPGLCQWVAAIVSPSSPFPTGCVVGTSVTP